MKTNNTNKQNYFKYLIDINTEELKINIKMYNLLHNYFIFIISNTRN